MLSFNEIPEYLDNLDNASRQIGAELFASLPKIGGEIIYTANSDITLQAEPAFIYLISGCLKWFEQERLVRLYSDGDWLWGNPNGAGNNSRVVSDFGCQVQVFARSEFIKILSTDLCLLEKWQSYQELQNRILLGLAGILSSEDDTPNFLVKSLRPGEVIVTEGSNSHEVYVMIEGQALVEVGGQPLGLITANEIFGEISFLTDQPRSASVVAKTACLVQIIEREQFALLIKTKPELLRRTATTLAQRLVELNRQLINLGEKFRTTDVKNW